MDANRLAMLLAVMHRHGGLQMSDQDVFVNVVGGVKVTETSADLTLVALAMVSSFRGDILPSDLVALVKWGYRVKFGLCPMAKERLIEAAKWF